MQQHFILYISKLVRRKLILRNWHFVLLSMENFRQFNVNSINRKGVINYVNRELLRKVQCHTSVLVMILLLCYLSNLRKLTLLVNKLCIMRRGTFGLSLVGMILLWHYFSERKYFKVIETMHWIKYICIVDISKIHV